MLVQSYQVTMLHLDKDQHGPCYASGGLSRARVCLRECLYWFVVLHTAVYSTCRSCVLQASLLHICVPASGGAQADRPGHHVSRLLFLRGMPSSFCCCSNMIFLATSTCRPHKGAYTPLTRCAGEKCKMQPWQLMHYVCCIVWAHNTCTRPQSNLHRPDSHCTPAFVPSPSLQSPAPA